MLTSGQGQGHAGSRSNARSTSGLPAPSPCSPKSIRMFQGLPRERTSPSNVSRILQGQEPSQGRQGLLRPDHPGRQEAPRADPDLRAPRTSKKWRTQALIENRIVVQGQTEDELTAELLADDFLKTIMSAGGDRGLPQRPTSRPRSRASESSSQHQDPHGPRPAGRARRRGPGAAEDGPAQTAGPADLIRPSAGPIVSRQYLILPIPPRSGRAS
ncbi:MAG: hypothetical protein M0C28_39150 [Candidatus Moduliflexus flocculans]|nr:hypothetical protein [Candidatus Moduliflexus flocculans]